MKGIVEYRNAFTMPFCCENFGTLIGFYAVECGNILGLGGAFLKYITPFGYCEGADIVPKGKLDGVMVAVGIAVGIVGIAIAYLKYTKKDIH